MASRTDRDRALDALYERVPDVACKGRCQPACGPIDASYRERARIRERTGTTLPTAREMKDQGCRRCPLLTDEGRCASYELRPMICRLWGASEIMPCRWGCGPADGSPRLDVETTYQLLVFAMDAGGGCADHAGLDAHDISERIAAYGKDDFVHKALAYIQQADNRDYQRATTQRITATFASASLLRRQSAQRAEETARQKRGY